jgi:hypothetical protein
MSSSSPSNQPQQEAPSELGDVLYGAGSYSIESEAEWAVLMSAIAQGDMSALYALYDRAHHFVYTLAMRMTGDQEAAEKIMLGVFLDVRRHAASFDAEKTTVLAWIMALARDRATKGGS